jgi:hypothetical protein
VSSRIAPTEATSSAIDRGLGGDLVLDLIEGADDQRVPETRAQRRLDVPDPIPEEVGEVRGVDDQRLNLRERRRDDEERHQHRRRPEDAEDERDREAPRHVPLEARGDGVDRERDDARQDEDRDRARDARDDVRRGREDREDDDRGPDAPNDERAHSGLHIRRRSVRKPARS